MSKLDEVVTELRCEWTYKSRITVVRIRLHAYCRCERSCADCPNQIDMKLDYISFESRFDESNSFSDCLANVATQMEKKLNDDVLKQTQLQEHL